MQNKLFAIMITALLVMLMAGSAMCATYDSSVTLVEKNVDWQPIEDGASATVWYNYDGDDFEWRLQAKGLKAETYYHLIYYADYDPRFDDWGGNNPGACLGTFYVPNNGTVVLNDQVTELDINMPEPPDYNIAPNPWDEYCNKSGRDAYERCCGAKLWIVPCNGYNPITKNLTGWSHADYLFETDLIWYDNTGHNITPEIIGVDTDSTNYHAGDTVNITVKVRDYDGVGDLESMVVTANFSEYGVEELVNFTYVGADNCVNATYTGSVVITEAGEVCGEVIATDPSGEYNDTEVCFNVISGSCAQLVIEGPDYALVGDGYEVLLDVMCEDAHGNHATDCECDLIASGHESLTVDWNSTLCSGNIVVGSCYVPDIVTIVAECDNFGVEPAVHYITFLAVGLDVTSEPTVMYELSKCGEPDCVNVIAQVVDPLGDPMAAPGYEVEFFVEQEMHGNATTDENGTATIELRMNESYGDEIDVFAIVDIGMRYGGATTIDVVEPVVDSVVVTALPRMMSGENQTLTYTCYTDHDTGMCCDGGEWSCNEFGAINNSTGYFVAGEHIGVAIVEVNVSGVVGEVAIVIDAEVNCTTGSADDPFIVTSDQVTLSGNFTDDGCACVQAIWNPIPEFDNDTRGAIVDVNETATEDVILDLAGEGDTWMLDNGNWSKYANGSVSEVSNGTYALVYDEPVLEPEEPTPTATTSRSSSGGGGGTYPPDPVPTPTPNATDNETDQDDPKPAATKTADVKPTVNLPGGDTTLDTTPDDEEDAPGGADPTNSILVVLGILALLVIGYVLYRRSQNGE